MKDAKNRRFSSSRRDFLRGGAGVALGLPFLRTSVKSAEAGIVRHASIGGGGMAAADLGGFASHPAFRLVAVAEIDLSRHEDVKKRYPDARLYQHWEELLEKEAGNIDSVNVSIPDHMHARVAAAFMDIGKHAYVQKPLSQTVAESRHLTQLAAERELVTQMGTQLASTMGNIRVGEVVRSGVIGKVKSAHLFSDKTWGDPNPLPDREDEVPEGFDWQGWLGVATDRPYINGIYHPGNWRRRLDFGTATLGDMGCHIFHPVFAGLELTQPLSVTAYGPKPNETNWAINSAVHYVFPGNELTEGDTVDFHWYDGNQRLPEEIREKLGEAVGARVPGQGSVIEGTKGLLLCPHDGLPLLAPFETLGRVEHPPQNYRSHWHEYLEACLGNEAVLRSSFDYAGPLTEAILLGCLATHFPEEKLEWEAEKLAFRGHEAATQLVTRAYREGQEIPGLPVPGA
jgi:predicted dehydrogenase